MRDAFGGYCNNQNATDSAFGSAVTRNPWKDGGCVPGAPGNVSITPNGYLWFTVSWEPPVDDGGSAIRGYKIQWKRGTQEYDSSRQETYTDLVFRDNRKFSIMQKRIWLSGYYQEHNIRVMAYNQNGDGAAAETSATPDDASGTDPEAPRLLRAQLWHDLGAIRLIYNEKLDGSSAPSRTAFTVYVNGEAAGRAGLGSSVWTDANRDHLVSFSFSLPGGIKPGDAVTVSYIPPPRNPIQDAAGNLAPAFSDVTVHNDQTSYSITSDPGSDKTYAFNNGAGEEDVIEATVTFGYDVFVSGVPELRLAIGGTGTTVWRRMRYHSGSGTSELVFRYSVREGDVDKGGILLSYTGAIATDHGLVRYASTKAEAPAWIGGKHHADHRVDGVRPTLVSADVVANGTDLDLRWDKGLDESSVPTASDPGFEVRDTSDNTARDISSISIDGRVATLTLSAAVSPTDHLEVSYEIPSSNPVKDAVGNYADDFSATAVSVTVTANSEPEFPTTEDGARSVDENTAAGQSIGTPVAATDGDSDPLTYSISGADAEFFEVVATSGQLRTKGALDHETQDSYTLTMSVHDGKDVHGNDDTTADDTISVTVTVNDVDDPPRITGPTYKEYQEGRTNDVATFSAADQDEPATLWDLTLTGDDSDDLSLSSSGVLTFNDVPDFENPTDADGDGRYEVTVNASEQGGTRTVSLDVTVWVWNRDEGASFPTAPSTWRVGREVTLELVDLDGIYKIVEWRWERSTNQSDWTVIPGAYSDTYTPTADDEDNYLRISVYYHDNHQWGKGFHYVTSQTVDAGPFYDAETASVSLAENTAEDTSIGQYEARHSDSGESLTYILTGGDLSYFDINSSTGELETSATPLDYEGLTDHEAEVEITARDSNSRTDSIMVTVTVTNECTSTGEPPCAPGSPSVSSASDTSLSVTWAAPGTPSGALITGYDLQYRESGSGGSWIPESVTGTDRTHTIENLIKDTTYEVQVRATNDGFEYGEWSPSGTGTPGRVVVRGGGGGGGGGGAPANRPPRIRGEDRPNYAENGTGPVVTYTVEDPDTGDKITWSLEGRDSRHMEISQDGALSFKEAPDYENPVDSRFDNTYEVTLRATDDGSPSQDDIHRVRVTVTNVNEAPVISGAEAVEYEENGEDGVGTYTAADPEGRDVASWGLAGDDAGLFSIGDAGELEFRDAPDYETPLDADEDNVYELTIQATDSSDNTGRLDVAVTVTDAEDDGMVGKYDMDGDKLIDKDEAVAAVADYFSDLITKEEVLEVVNQYFTG